MTKTLDDIPVKKVWQAQQAALMRLQLYATGRVHEIFIRCGHEVRSALEMVANEDGTVDGLGLMRAQQAIERVWKDTRDEWYDTLSALRWEAASLPFGSLAILHNFQFSKPPTPTPPPVGEGKEGEGPTFVFEPQLKRVMDAADQRLYWDGLHLSQRIWNLDRESLEGIKRELYAGVANGDSAWDIAKRVEQYLGAGQDCSRWTRTRLYSLTKKDIASGDRAGLVSGDECAGQGVAYNALRMTRTELQAIHHLATVEAMQHMPWVTAEQIFLSPAHPVADECDDVVNGGEKGDGVYPVGEIILPLHPNCLCGRRSVQMGQDEFVGQLRDWMNGTGEWAGMDEYMAWIGLNNLTADRSAMADSRMGIGDRPADWLGIWVAVEAAMSLLTWLWGDEAALNATIQRDVQLDLW